MLATVIRLSQGGVDFPASTTTIEGVASYQQHHLDARQRVNEFWETARRDLVQCNTCGGDIACNLQLHKDLPLKLWLGRGGRFVGGAHYKQATALFQPNKLPKWPNRIFPGKGWNGILVLPFYDLPQRICGFLFVGRDAEAKDFVYHNAYRNCQTPRKVRPTIETGLFMYDTLFSPTDSIDLFGNTVFVFNSPVIAARVQARHLLDHELPLPLVSTYSTRITTMHGAHRWLSAYTTWASQPGFRYVCWNPTFSANIISMAARLDGYVLFCPRSTNMQRVPSRGWLQYIHRHAMPWQQALEQKLLPLSQPQRINIVKQLDIPHAIFKDLICTRRRGLREALEAAEECRNIVNVAYAGQIKIVENNAGWQYASGQHVSNTIIHIEHLVQRSDQPDECYYQGKLIQGKQSIPFVEPVEAMEQNGAKIITRRLSAAGMQPLIANVAYKKKLIDIALQMRPPETIVSAGSFGWNPQLARFVFPQYELHIGGKVQLHKSILADQESPCLSFMPPASPPRFGTLLHDSPANMIFWAVAACVGANVIGRPLNQRPAGIGLIGLGATNIGQYIAKLFGCNAYSVPNKPQRSFNAAAAIQTAVKTHNWPVWLSVHNKVDKRAIRTWCGFLGDKDVLLPVDRYAADAMAIQSPWRFVTYTPELNIPPEMPIDGDKIFVHWLHDVVSRKLRTDTSETIFSLRILCDMARWVERNGGNSHIVYAAADILDDVGNAPVHQADRFVAMLYRFIVDGQLGIQQDGYNDKTVKLSLYRLARKEVSGIFIPRAVVNALLAKNLLPPVDAPHITLMLADANALDREYRYNDQMGWLVIESWWHERLKCCQHRQRLRIIS